MIPKPERDEQGKVVGDFYPIQKAELITLRKAKLINNTAFVHLALRFENPYCDRPISLIPKEFALRWQIPESSVYEAVAKLKSCRAISIKSGKVTIEWTDSQQDDNSENPEKVLESQKKLRNPRKKSGIPEKRSPEPLPDKDSNPLQTLQTYKDFTDSLSDAERESFENFVKEEWRKLTSRNKEAGQEIISLERFLAREDDFQNWYRKFLKSPVGRAAQKQTLAIRCDWRNDPRFTEWIWETYKRGYEWVEENIAEREQRSAFHDWAFEVNAFEGVCYD